MLIQGEMVESSAWAENQPTEWPAAEPDLGETHERLFWAENQPAGCPDTVSEEQWWRANRPGMLLSDWSESETDPGEVRLKASQLLQLPDPIDCPPDWVTAEGGGKAKGGGTAQLSL